MSRYSKLAVIALLGIAVSAPMASARPRVFVGGYFGPGFYGPYWYGPGFVAPFGYGYGYGPHTDMGKVKIDTKAKDAMVYVDGAYAGKVGQLKTFPLRAGAHNVELRDPSGHAYYQERIDVIAGRTIKLTP